MNLYAVLSALQQGKYTTMMWLGVTLVNCASLLLHDAIGIPFLSSGKLFHGDAFDTVRWATVIGSSVSSAIGISLPPVFAPGALETTARKHRLTIPPFAVSLCAVLAAGLFFVVLINHPFLFSGAGYAGETRGFLPRGFHVVFGSAAALSFLMAVTAVFGEKVRCGRWPTPTTAVFAASTFVTFGVMFSKGERGLPMFMVLLFMLLWHAHRGSFTTTARVSGFPGLRRVIVPGEHSYFSLRRAASRCGIKRSTLIVIAAAVLTLWLLVFARVRSIEGGIVSATAWKDAFASLFGYGELQAVTSPLSSMYHMVVCVSFWEDNFRLYGLSYLNLIYQQVPLALQGFTHISRPMSDPEYLSRLLPDQPGGIYILGQAYWNFGVFGMIGLIMLMMPALWSIERWLLKRSFGGAVVAISLAASMPKFMLYGMQWGVRNLTLLILFAVAMDWLMLRGRLRRKQ